MNSIHVYTSVHDARNQKITFDSMAMIMSILAVLRFEWPEIKFQSFYKQFHLNFGSSKQSKQCIKDWFYAYVVYSLAYI